MIIPLPKPFASNTGKVFTPVRPTPTPPQFGA